jgi:ATP-binding cassette subfamily C protein CydCD
VALDRRLLRRARSARLAVAAAVALGVATVLALAAQAWLLAALISGADRSRGAFAALLAVVLFRSVIAWRGEIVAARCSAGVKSELRAALLAKATAPGAAHDPGALTTLATRGIDALDGYFARYLPQVALAVIAPTVVVAFLLAQDWVSAAIVILTVPLIPLFMALVGASTRERMDAQVRSLQRLGGHFLDVVAGLPTLKVFGRAKPQADAIATVSTAYREHALGTLKVAFLSSLVLEWLATISMALVAVAIGLRLMGGAMTFETALFVLVLAPEAYWPLRRLGESYHAGAEGMAAATQILDRLDTPTVAGGRRSEIPDGPIEVGGLTVAPGEVLAITGPSGCGKTTLVRVLLGLQAGSVRIGGVDLRELDLRAWHATVAWVPQHPHLFAGTIADNVRFGQPEAPPEAVWRALADARLADAIAARPDGLETRLGDRGAGLSAGERQRLALARAFLRDAPLLVLDEPTAGLDGATEADVVRTIRRLVRGRTAVLVAHRPALLAVADRIVDLTETRAAA